MNNNGNNLDFLDMLTILSVMLQVMGYRNDMSKSSNDDLMKELKRQDKAYLEQIVENRRNGRIRIARSACSRLVVLLSVVEQRHDGVCVRASRTRLDFRRLDDGFGRRGRQRNKVIKQTVHARGLSLRCSLRLHIEWIRALGIESISGETYRSLNGSRSRS